MFDNLLFLNPWILTGLMALPALWYLLRVTPPVPRKIILPTTRFLEGLIPAAQTASHTPWWILLLRMIIAALVLIAFAGPVYNPVEITASSLPLRLVIDNGWASAQVWQDEMQAAQDALAEAARAHAPVYILTTAPPADGSQSIQSGPMPAAEGLSALKLLKPLPWPKDEPAVNALLKAAKPGQNVRSIYMSDGTDDEGAQELTDTLAQQGPASIITPPAARLPVLLRIPERISAGKLEMAITTPLTAHPRSVSIDALDDRGVILDRQTLNTEPGLNAKAVFTTPEAQRSKIARFALAGTSGAGSLYILDRRYQKKNVVLASAEGDTAPKPFIEARYYIERALEPYCTIKSAGLSAALAQKPSVIILPDSGALAPDILSALDSWVRGGGLLLRFAGPLMAAQGDNPLTPVPLRSGGRALDGAMAWEKPQKLKEFADTSPFAGLKLHEDITIRRQILADPATPDLDKQTWATLADGTPLITASRLGSGMLVMIHTSAEPSWSNLPLTGTFVDILRRIVDRAGLPAETGSSAESFFAPVFTLDGLGRAGPPAGNVQPIPAAEFDAAVPGPARPPGLYGGVVPHALNIGDRVQHVRPLQTAPGIERKIYGGAHEQSIGPYLLAAALILLLLDWLGMLVILRGLPRLRFIQALSLIALIFYPALSQAADTALQQVTAKDSQYAASLYLAYIRSGDPALDSVTEAGLHNLADVLRARTSVEPEGVVGLDPARDALEFFPIVYWAVRPGQAAPGEGALRRIQDYLGHGGVILIDTRDGGTSQNGGNPAVRNLIGRLDIPALSPIGASHVLLRSFYLLHEYPGRLDGGVLWVEAQSLSGHDNVSSVIVGANDWAGAWAEGGAYAGQGQGGTRAQEMSFRFGVNAVMYALTGNYKADQVHVKALLEKIGQ